MRFRLFLLAALMMLPAAASAEKVDMTPAELRKTATDVVVGVPTAIYHLVQREGDWQYTHYVAEVKVDQVEKGNDLQAGGLVYVRYWTRSWIGAGLPPPSTSGHRGLPAQGQKVRIYLARNAYDGFGTGNKDGGFNVIGANGFEPVK